MLQDSGLNSKLLVILFICYLLNPVNSYLPMTFLSNLKFRRIKTHPTETRKTETTANGTFLKFWRPKKQSSNERKKPQLIESAEGASPAPHGIMMANEIKDETSIQERNSIDQEWMFSMALDLAEESFNFEQERSPSRHDDTYQLPWGSRTLIRRMAPVKSLACGERAQMSKAAEEASTPDNVSPVLPYSLDTEERVSQQNKMPQVGVYQSIDSSLIPTPSAPTEVSFTVMQFNMLAHCYARAEIFPFAPQEILCSTERWEHTISEILLYNSDIVCLQELDKYQELKGRMQAAGYKGIFKRKGGGRKDGVAIFYKSKTFERIAAACVEYGKENENGVGVFSILRPKKGGSPICIGTTHLFWHPKKELIRLAQAEIFLGALKQFVSKEKKEKGIGENLPVVITGDLNTRPGAMVYRLIQNGELAAESKRFHHEFGQFRSAYSFYSQTFPAQVNGTDDREQRIRWGERVENDQASGEPAFTSCTEIFACTLDYIWFLEDRVCVEELLELPSFEYAAQERGLPSIHYPSDHVTMMAKLKYC